MNIKKRIPLTSLTAGIILSLYGASATLVHAAPGVLSDSPLFLKSNVEPNILFLMDDSGSMDWEIMSLDYGDGGRFTGSQPDGSNPASAGSVKHRDSDDDGTANCDFGDGSFSGYIYGVEFGSNNYGDDGDDCNTADDESWRFRNSDFNPLYFNPARKYAPWTGVDTSGNPFVDVPVTAAPNDPFDPTETIDLTRHNSNWGSGSTRNVSDRNSDGADDGFRYYEWTDLDGDGLFDNGEETEHLIKNEPAAVQQNFANWFSYYRSRQLVAKAAYGQVIASTNKARMGLVTLHNNNGVNTEITSMNNDPASGNKNDLLDSLYSFQPDSGTPLRTTLNNAGRYLACESNSFFSGCPAISASLGGECQQNFTVAMTDGFYNGSFDLTDDTAPSAPDDNADGDNNSSFDSANTGPFGDTDSNSLADIAMHYYETDLRSTVNDDVPTIAGVDENNAQHMVTYTIAFGVDGTLSAMPADTTSPFAWPDKDDGNAERIDDLRHAAWNSRGEYLSAQNPDELITGLRSALGSISGRVGSAASVAFNTGSLSTNSEVYLALFSSERWSGRLLAFALDPATGNINSTPNWSASTELDARNLSTTPRTILSHNGTDGIALQWSNLTTTQQNDFRTNAAGSQDNIATGMARLGFFRGDRNCEPAAAGTCSYTDGTNTFNTRNLRERDSRLGDILHSGPVYAGAPESGWPDTAPFPTSSGSKYSDFETARAGRAGVIYVGANDGMLHGFAQSNGREVLAYVPSALFSSSASEGLHYLSDPGYTHRNYVDLTPSIADVYVKTTSTGSASWNTVLVGGLRGGGRGLFALDITDPTTFSESGTVPEDIVMWEFTSSDDSDLGYTFSRPAIVPLEGPGSSIRWAAVFGNGYNDTGSGEAKLFVLLLDGGLDGTWTAGTDYFEITTGVGSTSGRNGLSTPAVIDSDGDGFADRAYAGDLFGNMWAFDLSGATTANWKVAFETSSVPVPLFTTASNQAITEMPVIVRNSQIPTSLANAPNTMVIFGSGQYLTTADITTTDTQSMYGVWDSGTKELGRGDLVEQVIGTGTTTGSVAGRTLTSNSVDYLVPVYGWYMDFPTSGERSITDPVIRGDRVFFNTTIPDSNPCNFGGTGWLMVANWIDGARPDKIAFDLDGDGALDDLDEIGGNAAAGARVTGLPTSPVNLGGKRYTATTETSGGDGSGSGSGGGGGGGGGGGSCGAGISCTDIEDLTGPNTGRLSWEEIVL